MELIKSVVAESIANFSSSKTSSPNSKKKLKDTPITINPNKIKVMDVLEISDKRIPLKIKVTPP